MNRWTRLAAIFAVSVSLSSLLACQSKTTVVEPAPRHDDHVAPPDHHDDHPAPDHHDDHR